MEHGATFVNDTFYRLKVGAVIPFRVTARFAGKPKGDHLFIIRVTREPVK